MADVKSAVDFVIRQEDARMDGIITRSPGDRGGTTRWGLTERWHPELVASGFFSTMDRDDSLLLAEQTYTDVYSGPLALTGIEDQALATALLSFAVVEGNFEAITLFQRALVAGGARIAVDGIMGPATVGAANSVDPGKTLATLVALQKQYFLRLATANPSQTKWVAGWDNRADALLAIPTESDS